MWAFTLYFTFFINVCVWNGSKLAMCQFTPCIEENERSPLMLCQHLGLMGLLGSGTLHTPPIVYIALYTAYMLHTSHICVKYQCMGCVDVKLNNAPTGGGFNIKFISTTAWLIAT